MKPILTTLMAAALLAGNLPAQTTAEFDAMLLRLAAMRDEPISSPAEVVALVEQAKAMIHAPWAYGVLTDEQRRNNNLIFAAASLIGRKISFATGRDFSVSKTAWECAVLYGRRSSDPREVIDFAAKWMEADPASLSAKLEWFLVRAFAGQDIREELAAFLGGHPHAITGIQVQRAITAWNKAAKEGGKIVVLEEAKTFLSQLAAATLQDPINQRSLKTQSLAYRASLNDVINAEIVALLESIQGSLPLNQATTLFGAFSPAAATREQALTFYDAMLRAVQADATSASFLRKVLDQKLKLQ